MSMKKILAVGIVVSTLILTGCGNAGTTSSGSSINVIHVDTGNGHMITCVSVGGSSVDCDWNNE